MSIRQLVLPLAVACTFVLVACDDDPFRQRWSANADTVRIFALSIPQMNVVSAIDFARRVPVRLEAPATQGNWDLAVDFRNGGFVWLPAGALGLVSEAAVAPMEPGKTFLTADVAPGDTAVYARRVPLPLNPGGLYVIKTREQPGSFGSICSYYGKVEILDLDTTTGGVTFQFDVSPVCNSRELIPQN